MNYNDYKPSKLIKDMNDNNKLTQLSGLSKIVKKMKDNNCIALIDYDEDYIEKINSKNAKMAVHETDLSYIIFVDKETNIRIGWIMVIPENGEDWLSNYSDNELMNKVINGIKNE